MRKIGSVVLCITLCFACTSRLHAAQLTEVCDVSKADANDLLALFVEDADDLISPAIRCTMDDPELASDFCIEKAQIVKEEARDHGWRLIAVRVTSPKDKTHDDVLAFGCEKGRMTRLWTKPGFQNVQFKHPTPDELTIESGDKRAGASSDEETLYWKPISRRYAAMDEVDHDVSGFPALTIPCNRLKTVSANDLIILANGEFEGSGGFFPFTHGEGCYGFEVPGMTGTCEFRVTLGEDRMISAHRREITFGSNHETGTGAWGYSYIFGCVGGQVHLMFGFDSPAGGDLDSECDKNEPTPAATPEAQPWILFRGHESSSRVSPSNGAAQPVAEQPIASPASTPAATDTPIANYDCHDWDDARSDRLTLSLAEAASGDPSCCPSVEETLTLEWRPKLRNYVITSVRYSR
jgi:hypothetical protein